MPVKGHRSLQGELAPTRPLPPAAAVQLLLCLTLLLHALLLAPCTCTRCNKAPRCPAASRPPPPAESLGSLLNPEWLDGDNAYFCEHCQKKVGAAPLRCTSACCSL